MNYDTYETDTVQLTLPLHESQQLDQFLEYLIQQLGHELLSTSLETTSESIGDANAVALWLREYAKLELPAANAIELVEALTHQLDDDSLPETVDDAVLARIRDELKTSLLSVTSAAHD